MKNYFNLKQLKNTNKKKKKFFKYFSIKFLVNSTQIEDRVSTTN